MDHLFIYATHISSTNDVRVAEISCVRTNGNISQPKKTDVIGAFSTVIDSGYSFKRAVEDIKRNVVKNDEPFVVVTYLSDLTRPLIRKECKQDGIDELFALRVWIDIAQLAWPLVSNGSIKGRSIEDLSKYFGVQLKSKEDSAEVCTAIVGIYGHMMRRYKTALAGEEVVRDIGGETLEGLRRMMGF